MQALSEQATDKIKAALDAAQANKETLVTVADSIKSKLDQIDDIKKSAIEEIKVNVKSDANPDGVFTP